MENTRKSEKESSFAGFLKSYSKGNIAFQTHVLETHVSDIAQLAESIQNVIKEIGDLKIKTDDVVSTIRYLQNSIEQAERKESPIETLEMFSIDIDLSIMTYNILKNILGDDKLISLKKSINVEIFNFLTLAKKVGGGALIEKAISIAEKF